MTHDGRNDRPDEPTGAEQSETLLERQLEALIEGLEIEQAPPSLTRRLYRIPEQQRGHEAWWRRWLPTGTAPRWVLAPALAAGVLALGVALLLPRQPSPQEVFQARQDLALAFGYIDKAGVLTGREIQSVLGDELHHVVKDNLSKSIPFTEQSRKEETT
jgi:hypothetical protein